MTEVETGEGLAGKLETLLKQFEAIQTDTDQARFHFLQYPWPHVHNAVQQLRTLWRSLERLSSDETLPKQPKSSETPTLVAEEASASSAPKPLDEFPHRRELVNLVEKEAELLSHVPSLLDHNDTPPTPDHPGVSPISLLESETREKLRQLSEAEWWLTHELKHEIRKSSDKGITRSLAKAIARNREVQTELRRELHTAHKEHALAQAEHMLQRASEAAQDADSDFAAFRDACRLVVARHDMQRHQGALKRRARVMARDEEALPTREMEDAAGSIGEMAEKVSDLVGSLQGRAVDDGVRDAIDALRETSRTRRR